MGYLPYVHHPATAAPAVGGPIPGHGDAITSEIEARVRADVEADRAGDAHLRSLDYITGFGIQATDGNIGHVDDFLLEEESWKVRYLVVDTVNWWPGKKVLVAPDWARHVSWSERSISVELPRERIKQCPEYDTSVQLDRSYEERLYGHYGYPPYWF